MGWAALRSSGMTTLRRLRSARGGAVVLLTYHRVAESDSDPLGLCTSPARFFEHVEALASRYELMAAGEVFQALADRRRLPNNGVAITLDDGYADALSTAHPILEAHGAPATVFVCSGLLDGARRYWWDELEQLVFQGRLPDRLGVDVPGASYSKSTAAIGDSGPEDRREIASWNVSRPPTHPRARLYLELASLIEPLAAAGRETVLEQLREQVVSPPRTDECKRPMSADEVKRLDAGGLVEIGAHTANHVRLASLTPAEQREEITSSKNVIEAACDHSIRAFSYPYGTSGSYTGETAHIVREAGFAGACTTRLGSFLPWGSASRGTNRYEVPRTATAGETAAELIDLIDKRLGL